MFLAHPLDVAAVAVVREAAVPSSPTAVVGVVAVVGVLAVVADLKLVDLKLGGGGRRARGRGAQLAKGVELWWRWSAG